MIVFKKFEPLIVWIWAFCIVFFTFSFIASDPANVIIGTGGDGAKNYYTFLYHSLYEHGIWFGGMNYPYGEHIVFPDLQPLIAQLYITVNNCTPLSPGAALGLMHLCICLSFVLALVYNCKILRHFNCSFFWSLIVATCIGLMSPQMLRISGHYALAYPSFTAMLFYFTLRYSLQKEKRYAVFIFLLGAIMYFIHPYFLALSLVWIGFYSLSYFIIYKKQKTILSLKYLLPLWVSCIAMFLIAKGFMLATDPVKDRPQFPHGAMAYGATGPDFTTSDLSPIWHFLKEKSLVSEVSSGGEGYGYVGLTCIAAILLLITISIIRKIKKQQTAIIELPGIWLLMSVFLLLFGMGVPFVWNMEWLLNYLSIFRQFRSLGRFIWLFYQVITVISFIILYRYSIAFSQKRKVLAKIILIFPVLIWCIETCGYIEYARNSAKKGKENYELFLGNKAPEWDIFLKNQGRSATDFQAILLLPYLHVGSEKWSAGTNNTDLMGFAFKASLQTKLPIVNSMMPRSSWELTAKQVRISGGPYADKPLLQTKNRKPFLLIVAKDEGNFDEKYLLESADFLGDFDNCKIYSFYPERIIKNDKEAILKAKAIAEIMSGSDTALNPQNGFVFTNHLDQNEGNKSLWGNGSLGIIKGKDSIIAEINVQPNEDNILYEISSWVLVSERDFRSPVLNLSLLDENGTEIFRKDAMAKESLDNYGLWLRVNQYFNLPKNCRKIIWHLYDDDKRSYLALDEILLRPAAATIIYKNKGKIMANNHLLKN